MVGDAGSVVANCDGSAGKCQFSRYYAGSKLVVDEFLLARLSLGDLVCRYPLSLRPHKALSVLSYRQQTLGGRHLLGGKRASSRAFFLAALPFLEQPNQHNRSRTGSHHSPRKSPHSAKTQLGYSHFLLCISSYEPDLPTHGKYERSLYQLSENTISQLPCILISRHDSIFAINQEKYRARGLGSANGWLAGMVSYMDDAMGAIEDALRTKGL